MPVVVDRVGGDTLDVVVQECAPATAEPTAGGACQVALDGDMRHGSAWLGDARDSVELVAQGLPFRLGEAPGDGHRVAGGNVHGRPI